MGGNRIPLAKRFWAHVDRRGPDECWPFLRRDGTPVEGYGRIHEGGADGKLLMATRVSWELEHGVPLPEHQEALHRCDWPPCVSPAHLFAGTQSANILDAVGKGRHVPPKGARNGRSKLTEQQTAEIRRLRSEGIAGKEVALRFGVSPATVSMIHRGHRWGSL